MFSGVSPELVSMLDGQLRETMIGGTPWATTREALLIPVQEEIDIQNAKRPS